MSMIKMVPSIFGKVYTTEELIQLRDELNELLVSDVTASEAPEEEMISHEKAGDELVDQIYKKKQIEKWFLENPKYEIDFTPQQLDQLSQFFIDEKIDFEKFKEYCSENIVYYYISIFMGAFRWVSTEEGDDYWLNIYNKWEKLCK